MPGGPGDPASTDLAKADTQPVGGAQSLDRLWDVLPLEVVQRIAWLMSPPTLLVYVRGESNARLQDARAIGESLLRLALASRAIYRCVHPLLRLARWSVELALLADQTTLKPPIDLLLANPAAPLAGELESASLELRLPDGMRRERLDALLQNTLWHTHTFNAIDVPRTAIAQTLLGRLFEAWCARLQKDTNAAARLNHLPLDDLPLRLFCAVSGNAHAALDPFCMTEPLGYTEGPTHTPTSMPAMLLLQHLHRFDESLKLFVWLHLDQLFEGDGEQDGEAVLQAVQAHGLQDDAVLAKVRRWNEGFVHTPDKQIDPALAREVLEGLQAMPLLGAGVTLVLLLRFCCGTGLRALAGDALLIGFIHRAMAEMAEMAPDVTEYRFEYLLNHVPQELGLAAFQLLSAEQRAVVLKRGAEADDKLEPYTQAALDATDSALPAFHS